MRRPAYVAITHAKRQLPRAYAGSASSASPLDRIICFYRCRNLARTCLPMTQGGTARHTVNYMQVIFGLFAPPGWCCPHARKVAIASRICRLCLKRKPTRPHNLLLPVPESSANLLATDTGRHRPARWQLHASYICAIRAARSELPSSKAAIASRICRLCLKRKPLPGLPVNVILWRILCARSCRTRPA